METPHVMRIASRGDAMREVKSRWSMMHGVSHHHPADCTPHTAPCQGAVNPHRTVCWYTAEEQLGMQNLSDDF